MKSNVSFLLVLSLLLCDCKADEDFLCESYKLEDYDLSKVYEVTVIDEILLPSTTEIRIDPYDYISGGIHFSVRGEESLQDLSGGNLDLSSPCMVYNMIDRNSVSPTLRWQATEGSLVVAAIFRKKLQQSPDGKKISNDGDAVWGWHSGLPNGGLSGGVYEVRFEDGRAIVNHTISNSKPAELLKTNTIYYWAVWMWDDQGVNIIKTSRQIPFLTVTDDNTSFYAKEPFQLKGSWHLTEALDNLGNDATQDYSLKNFEIKAEACESEGTIAINQTDHQLVFGPDEIRFLDYRGQILYSDCNHLIGELQQGGAKVYTVTYVRD